MNHKANLFTKNPQKGIRKKVNSSRIKGKGYEKIVQKGVQTAHKHMERCSGSFIIKEMQVEWNKQTSIRLTNQKFDNRGDL